MFHEILILRYSYLLQPHHLALQTSAKSKSEQCTDFKNCSLAIDKMIQQSLFSHLCMREASKITSLQQQHSYPASILRVIDVSHGRCLTAC